MPDTHTSLTEAKPALYSGGDLEVGEPSYQQDGVVAYEIGQAKDIFKNVMDAKIKGEIIPFIDTQGNDGTCPYRRDAMIEHMLRHQNVDRRAIGVAISVFSDNHLQRKMIDYVTTIGHAMLMRSANTGDGVMVDTTNNYAFHTAPTINVIIDGLVTPMVLDPSLCANPATYAQWRNAQMQHVDTYHYSWGSEKELMAKHRESEMPKPGSEDICRNQIGGIKVHDTPYDDQGSSLRSGVELALDSVFAEGRKNHHELSAQAKELGIDSLPNSGPLALRAVNQALSKSAHQL